MAKEGKISVTHYLDKRKKNLYKNSGLYPLYVRVIVKRKPYNFPSQCFRFTPGIWQYDFNIDLNINPDALYGYYSEAEFNDSIIKKSGNLYYSMLSEKKAIHDIIKLKRPFEKDDFTLNNFSKEYQCAIENFRDILAKYLKDIVRYQMEDFSKSLHTIIDWENVRFFDLAKAIHYMATGKFLKSGIEIDPGESPLYEVIDKQHQIYYFYDRFEKEHNKKFRYYEIVKDNLLSDYYEFIKGWLSPSVYEYTRRHLDKIVWEQNRESGL
jgi:hypothetical protein